MPLASVVRSVDCGGPQIDPGSRWRRIERRCPARPWPPVLGPSFGRSERRISVVRTENFWAVLRHNAVMEPGLDLSALPRVYRIDFRLQELGADDDLIGDCNVIGPASLSNLIEIGRQELAAGPPFGPSGPKRRRRMSPERVRSREPVAVRSRRSGRESLHFRQPMVPSVARTALHEVGWKFSSDH